MAASASWTLQSAIHGALTGDATLLTLLGGPRVYDGAPQAAAFPYVTFGQSNATDWSATEGDGEEHIVTLHVWSETGRRKEVLAIMAAIRTVLHEATPALTGHRLINLRQEFADVRRESDGEIVHGTLRYRAVTEPTT